MRERDKRLRQAYKQLRIKPGDIYESCSYHPVLCFGIDYRRDEVWGVSLVDGSYPHSCSLLHCGVRKLSPKQAWQIRTAGPLEVEAREKFKPTNRWWHTGSEASQYRVRLVGPRNAKQSRPKRGGVGGYSVKWTAAMSRGNLTPRVATATYLKR